MSINPKISQEQCTIQKNVLEKEVGYEIQAINQMQPLVKAIAKKYSNIINYDELLQEGNYHLIEAIRTYDENKNIPFLAYAKSKVFYGVFNYVRSEKAKQVKHVYITEETESLIELIADDNAGVEEHIQKQEQIKTIHEALKQLSVEQRTIILRHYFNGEKCTDIAFEKGVHYKAVLQMKKRALLKLKKIINDD